jgi:hypothetical protein
MSIRSDIEQCLDRALHLLNWLPVEAVSEGAFRTALSADQIRDVLLPARAALRAMADGHAAELDHPAGSGGVAEAEGASATHWVLIAIPRADPAAPLGCYSSLETAKRAAEEWSGSPLDWRWMVLRRNSVFRRIVRRGTPVPRSRGLMTCSITNL